MLTTDPARSRLPCLLASLAASLVLSIAPPAQAQNACTTNYCVKSQTSPSRPRRLALRHHRDLLPDALGSITGRNGLGQWHAGHDLHRQCEIRDYLPELRSPGNLSQDFPLNYENPKIGIGVAWPNGKDYRYAVESIPIVDGEDGTCADTPTLPAR